MIQLSAFQLKMLLQEAAIAGAQKAMEAMEPKGSLLTKNEVIRWFRSIGLPSTHIEKMEKENLITGHRTGSSANSTIRYKKSDIQTALQALDLFPIINL